MARFLRRTRKITIILIIAIALPLITARIYLPFWLKDYVNGQIAELDDYSGSVQDIDVYLWRGAYQIQGMNIRKNESGLDKPFIKADIIDLSVQWKALFNGAIVAEIDVYNADINFSKTQTGEGENWTEFVNDLTPFDINRTALHGGRVSYTDYTAEPNIYLYVDSITATLTNIRNVTDKEVALPSDLKVSGTSIGKGKVSVEGKMNILQETPDFDFSFKLESVSLPALNNYANDSMAIDFESGTIDIYAELAAANGRLAGYIKPIARDINIVNIEQDTNPFNIIWESIVSVFVTIFENYSKDQFALRIPLEGNLKKPEGDMWSAFLSIFSNAFVEAFPRSEDGTIDFQDALEKANNENDR